MLLLASSFYAKAQKNIGISDSLVANADQLTATPGSGLKNGKYDLGNMMLLPVKQDGEAVLPKGNYSVQNRKTIHKKNFHLSCATKQVIRQA